MFGMNKKQLQLLPHNPMWKQDFQLEKERILSAVQDSTIQIEHIGSTSIPNIHAKPILDIAILCGEKGLEIVANSLKNLGYDYRGQFEMEIGHYYAVLDKGDIRLCQVHIYSEPTNDWFSKLKFRDVLTENEKLAKEYNDYKIELAQTVSSKKEYAEIKDKWVDKFILKLFSEK
ncbi:MAG: GrpB family protein [Pyrinomonadaceae bacterium]|nr:GrpB family protein [Pyrinomonadaceae bacterium]